MNKLTFKYYIVYSDYQNKNKLKPMELFMNTKLITLRNTLKNKLNELNDELIELEIILKEKEKEISEKEQVILENYVPDTSMKTINFLKNLFPDLTVDTKKILFFEFSFVSLSFLRIKVSILADKSPNLINGWSELYAESNIPNINVNNKKIEITEYKKILYSTERLIKINKNKLSTNTVQKIDTEVSHQVDYISAGHNLDFVMLWAAFISSNEISHEIIGLENDGEFEDADDSDTDSVAEVVTISHENNSDGPDAGEWNKIVFD